MGPSTVISGGSGKSGSTGVIPTAEALGMPTACVSVRLRVNVITASFTAFALTCVVSRRLVATSVAASACGAPKPGTMGAPG